MSANNSGAPDLFANSRAQLKIDELASRIQSLPQEIRWAYVQQDVIAAIAMGVPLRPGMRTRQIDVILGWAAKVGLTSITAKLASLALLIVLYWRQPQQTAIAESRVFVGIKALREAELVARFEAMAGGPALVVDQRPAGALAVIRRPGAARLLRAWRDAVRSIFAHLALDRDGLLLDRMHLLNFLVRRLHHYAHALAVFRELKTSNPQALLAFSTADLWAFAAIRAGFNAIYFQHGFLRRSLVFPDFNRVMALDEPEARYIKRRLPVAAVAVSAPPVRPLRTSRRVAVVGDYGDKLHRSRDLINFCRTSNIDVVIRPHPADRTGYWAKWEGVDGLRIDREGSFDEFLDRHCPSAMATWYSTTIYEALLRGVLPITFESEQLDVVFPFAEVALRWPDQQQAIKAVLVDPPLRYEALAKSLSRVLDALPARSALEKIKEFEGAVLNLEAIQY